MLPDNRGVLARQAGALSHELTNLVEKLKRSTAEAIARAAAAVVNAAVHSALGGGHTRPETPTFLPPRPAPWQERTPPSWSFDPIHGERQDLEEEDWRERATAFEDDPDDPVVQPEGAAQPRRWSEAVVLAFQAAAWWLRNRSSLPLTALGVGLAAGLVALLLGGLTVPVGALLSLGELLLAGATLCRRA